jgi:hypothetical protein
VGVGHTLALAPPRLIAWRVASRADQRGDNRGGDPEPPRRQPDTFHLTHPVRRLWIVDLRLEAHELVELVRHAYSHNDAAHYSHRRRPPGPLPATASGPIGTVTAVTQIPPHQIRAVYDAETITVYQAYSPEIADSALAHGRFVGGFKRERMTWIKPSFLWMMYRCGWASKPGQERVLAIRIRRDGFDWAIANSALSSYEPDVHADHVEWKRSLRAPVRVQWDPERDLHLRPLPHRAIQIGLGGESVDRYVDDWIISIDDITGSCHEIHALVGAGDLDAATARLPAERPYPATSR